jgi:hypothetical protein
MKVGRAMARRSLTATLEDSAPEVKLVTTTVVVFFEVTVWVLAISAAVVTVVILTTVSVPVVVRTLLV